MKYAYPELLRKGTAAGPVTVEMRDRCREKVRVANRMMKCSEEDGMDYWPDFLPIVREEMKYE